MQRRMCVENKRIIFLLLCFPICKMGYLLCNSGKAGTKVGISIYKITFTFEHVNVLKECWSGDQDPSGSEIIIFGLVDSSKH